MTGLVTVKCKATGSGNDIKEQFQYLATDALNNKMEHHDFGSAFKGVRLQSCELMCQTPNSVAGALLNGLKLGVGCDKIGSSFLVDNLATTIYKDSLKGCATK